MIRPTSNRMFVIPDADERAGAFIIATSERRHRGTVAAIGPGKLDKQGRLIAPDVRVGDRVEYGFVAAFPSVTVDGQRYLAMREDDAVFVIQTAPDGTETLRTLRDVLIVEPDNGMRTTASGFVISRDSDVTGRGMVRMVGTGWRDSGGTVRPLTAQVGDTVIYPEMVGQQVRMGAKTWLAMRECDIGGILREEIAA